MKLARCAVLAALGLLLAIPASAPAKRVSVTGKLELLHADNFKKGTVAESYYLHTGQGKRLRLRLGREARSHAGQRVTIAGDTVGGSRLDGVDGTVAVDSLRGAGSAARSPVARAALGPGPQRVAVIMLNFSNDRSTPAGAGNAVFGSSSSVDAFYREESNGDMSLYGDVYGWFPINAPNAPCYSSSWSSQARTMAQDQGLDLSGYDYYIYVWPYTTACNFGGLGQIGGNTSWINGSPHYMWTYVHELGHNLSLRHATALDCGTGQPSARVGTPSGCTHYEYGDPFDVMGGGGRHNSSINKETLDIKTGNEGFFPGTVSTVPVVDGTYTLTPSEPSYTGTQLLRIPTRAIPSSIIYPYYQLEYRRPFGVFDAFSPSDPVVNGVTIRMGGDLPSTGTTRLIDTTGGDGSFANAPLAVGKVYRDPEANIAIRTLSTSSASAQVQVQTLAGKVFQIDDTVSYAAQAGTSNDVRIQQDGGSYTVADRGVPALAPGIGCSATADPQAVSCPAAGVARAEITLADGNDAVVNETSLASSLDGGAGIDSLQGGSGNDRLRGGSSSDLLSGGAGSDMADYSERTRKVRVSLDGRDDDGEGGEKDSIAADVEGVIGSVSSDRLTGSSGADVLDGGGGKDQIKGAASKQVADEADLIFGGSGNDKIYGYGGADVIDGGSDNDSIFGGDGNDELRGSTGYNKIRGEGDDDTLFSFPNDRAVLDGGDGNDTLNAQDGDALDRVSCGIGTDTATVDAGDRVRNPSECEA